MFWQVDFSGFPSSSSSEPRLGVDMPRGMGRGNVEHPFSEVQLPDPDAFLNQKKNLEKMHCSWVGVSKFFSNLSASKDYKSKLKYLSSITNRK